MGRMRNPIMDYLRGNDLRSAAPVAPPAAKGITLPDAAVNILQVEYVPPLIHGPGTPPWGEQRGYDFNSAVFACLVTYADAFIEAPPRVFRLQAQGKSQWIEGHPWQVLLDEPNPAMSGLDLLWYAEYCRRLDGNAYWRKLRSGNETTGNVVQLWPISPANMHPVTTPEDAANGVFISYYRYDYAPGKWEAVPVENIVHFKLGMDDQDHRVGLAPIKRLVREVAGDDEATLWAQAMLANGGAAGMMVTPPENANFTQEQAQDLKARLKQEFGGPNRGAIAVLSPGAKVEEYGATPDKMDMRSLHYLPETRIAAVMRVPAVVAGLSAGLEKSGQYSNFKEAREQFVESTILPSYLFCAAKINQALRGDFANSDRRVVVRFDITDMRVLQEDEDKKYARLNIGVQGKWITPNEARADVGLPPIDGGDELAAPAPPSALPDANQPPANMPPGKGRTLKGRTLSSADFPDFLRALVDLAEPQMEADVQRYFQGQKRRVQRALEEQAG